MSDDDAPRSREARLLKTPKLLDIEVNQLPGALVLVAADRLLGPQLAKLALAVSMQPSRDRRTGHSKLLSDGLSAHPGLPQLQDKLHALRFGPVGLSIRTFDLRFRKPLLCPAELQGRSSSLTMICRLM